MRRRLFDLHSWLGFNLAACMTLVTVTGTLAVISDEIDWLLKPELRASAGTADATWDDIDRILREQAPGHVVTALTTHEADYLNYRATMIDPNGRRYYLYIDPVTGEFAGTTGTLTVQRFLRDLHRYLFLPAVLGLPLVTTMAVVLMISLYSGLKTVRNWRTVATRIRLRQGTRVVVGDYHKAAGLWSTWFFVIIIVTSFWYFAEFTAFLGGSPFEPSPLGPSADRTMHLATTGETASTAQLIAAAQGALPGLWPREVFFPRHVGDAVVVNGRLHDPLVRNRSNRVSLDPMDASVINVQRSAELGLVAYVNNLADPLHFGSFGGLVTKLIWFGFGTVLVSLSITGVWLTWRRLRRRTPSTAQLATLPLLLIVSGFGVPYVRGHLDDALVDNAAWLLPRSVEGIEVRMSLVTDTGERRRARFLYGRARRVGESICNRPGCRPVLRPARVHRRSSWRSVPLSPCGRAYPPRRSRPATILALLCPFPGKSDICVSPQKKAAGLERKPAA